MKKFLSFVLVLVMVCSLSVTAFAAGEQNGTTTLTANIPNEAAPSYTIHIPADMTLEYGNTEKQFIGVVEVSDQQNCRHINVTAPYTMLINKEDSSDSITLKLSMGESKDNLYEVIPATGLDTVYNTPFSAYHNDDFYHNRYFSQLVYAQVEDWSGATPGATYQAVITFQFYVP